MARIVVTGGAGFLGSHLCHALVDRGDTVVALDNLVTGTIDNVSELFGRPRFTFYECDVTEDVDVGGDVDAVLHFASPASPPDFTRIPIEIMKAGSMATHRCLELARATGARFMLASTSEVYGDPHVHPQPETYAGNSNPVGPRSVYDEAKRYAEALTSAYHRSHTVEVRIARIFNMYGPNMRVNDGRVVPNFVNQALNDEPLIIYGDGTQTRSFTFVDDGVKGLLSLLESDVPTPVNIGNPAEFTIRELAEAVIDVTESSSEIVYEDPRVDDPVRRKPDIALARSALGWNPTTELRSGIEMTVRYFEKLKAA